MDEPIELLAEEQNQQTPGVRIPGPVLVSVVVHILLIIVLIETYHPIRSDDRPVPIAHYIELIKQNPRDFTEAPGKKVDKAPLNALWSDANRKASAPKPTGDTPTQRPGDHGMYAPPLQHSAQAPAQQPSATEDRGPRTEDSPSRIPALRTSQAAMSSDINWHDAIKEVGKVASLGGNQNLDLNKLGGAEGGQKGFVEQGPLSFETQWYDWGEYAQSMVSKIRINWYDNMPPLIRTGMKGVVTIRFTIQRNGTITDVTIINSSGVPPYDFAAKKAIELSSRLNPLPKDFPKSSERVTAMFFYNSEPPTR